MGLCSSKPPAGELHLPALHCSPDNSPQRRRQDGSGSRPPSARDSPLTKQTPLALSARMVKVSAALGSPSPPSTATADAAQTDGLATLDLHSAASFLAAQQQERNVRENVVERSRSHSIPHNPLRSPPSTTLRLAPHSERSSPMRTEGCRRVLRPAGSPGHEQHGSVSSLPQTSSHAHHASIGSSRELPAPHSVTSASPTPQALSQHTPLTRPPSLTNTAPSPFPRTGSGFGGALIPQSNGNGAGVAPDNTKADYLAFLAHELRNPLHNVIGVTELLLSSGPLNAEQRELLESLALSSSLMSRIVNDVLDLGKIKSGHLELELVPFDLMTLLRDIERMFARRGAYSHTAHGSSHQQAQKEQQVEWTVRTALDASGGSSAFAPLPPASAGGHMWLMGDATRLLQILTNLLSNAFKFTTRGSVRLFVRIVQLDEEGNVIEEQHETPAAAAPAGNVPSPPDVVSATLDQLTPAGGEANDASEPSVVNTSSRSSSTAKPRQRGTISAAQPIPSHRVNMMRHSSTDGGGGANGVVWSPSGQSSNIDGALLPRPESRAASRATILEHHPRVAGGSPYISGHRRLASNDIEATTNRDGTQPITPPGTEPLPVHRLPSHALAKHISMTTTNARGSAPSSPFLAPVSGLMPSISLPERAIDTPPPHSRSAEATTSPPVVTNSAGGATAAAPEQSTGPVYVEFTCQDTGLGISAENLPRLFEDYTQAKISIAREFGGTGLGLSIVRTLVDLHNGSLRVSSELGAGTSFTCCIPFARADAPPSVLNACAASDGANSTMSAASPDRMSAATNVQPLVPQMRSPQQPAIHRITAGLRRAGLGLRASWGSGGNNGADEADEATTPEGELTHTTSSERRSSMLPQTALSLSTRAQQALSSTRPTSNPSTTLSQTSVPVLSRASSDPEPATSSNDPNPSTCEDESPLPPFHSTPQPEGTQEAASHTQQQTSAVLQRRRSGEQQVPRNGFAVNFPSTLREEESPRTSTLQQQQRDSTGRSPSHFSTLSITSPGSQDQPTVLSPDQQQRQQQQQQQQPQPTDQSAEEQQRHLEAADAHMAHHNAAKAEDMQPSPASTLAAPETSATLSQSPSHPSLQISIPLVQPASSSRQQEERSGHEQSQVSAQQTSVASIGQVALQEGPSSASRSLRASMSSRGAGGGVRTPPADASCNSPAWHPSPRNSPPLDSTVATPRNNATAAGASGTAWGTPAAAARNGSSSYSGAAGSGRLSISTSGASSGSSSNGSSAGKGLVGLREVSHGPTSNAAAAAAAAVLSSVPQGTQPHTIAASASEAQSAGAPWASPFMMPLSAPSSADSAALAAHTAPSAIRVLLVEDNSANAKLGRFMLQKRGGFSVSVASDGVEAVDMVVADGRARRDGGAPPPAGVSATPGRRIVTLVRTAGGSSSGTSNAHPAADAAGHGESASADGERPSSRQRTHSLTTVTTLEISPGVASSSASSVLDPLATPGSGALLPTPHSVPAGLNANGITPQATSPGITNARTPQQQQQSGAASAGAEPSAFDASYSSYSVILMDLSMPRMSGTAAAQLLRSGGFSGRIVALTASDSDAQRRACLEAGMDGLLSKPFKADELVSVVLSQHCLTHADPPMQPVARSHASHPYGFQSNVTSSISPLTQSSSPAVTSAAAAASPADSIGSCSDNPQTPLQPRTMMTSASGSNKHTLIVRAKTQAERQDTL